MEKILLNGKWKLFMADEGEYSFDYDAFTSSEQLEKSEICEITGNVPGNFELDMRENGILPELFYGKNILEVQKLEYKHLWYCRTFNYKAENYNDTFLVFDGIDTFAEIYLNGEHIGSATNMLVPHEFSVTNKLKGNNEIVVHIKPTAFEAQKYPAEACCNVYQKYNAGSLATRKAAHMFGWDIMPRALSGGLWRDVFIKCLPKRRIEEIYAYTVKADSENAEVWVYYRLNPIIGITGYQIKLTGVCTDSSFETAEKLWHNEGRIQINIGKPKLWWPKNMGDPLLYDVSAELLCENEIIDCRKFKFGIRTVTLDRTNFTDKNGNGEFRFYINGKPMFVMGTNWVPLDAFHSRDKERLPTALKLLDEIGCNMVRCWGGNVYEDHEFFDFCDSHGITVWQDFAMGCAAYPQTEKFCDLLKEEAVAVVKKLRGHPSLVLWAGDNECDEAVTEWSSLVRNPSNNKLTRTVLPNIIRRHDPIRDFLPSSPYIDGEVFKEKKFGFVPEKHLWGPRDYFKSDFYKNSPAHFASETGYHGCPVPDSVKKFISADKLWPPYGNDEWLIHAACMEDGNDVPYAYRIPLMISQVKTFWGEVPDELRKFSIASQISQAEAVKYFIERFRYGKWRRTGIIWWNLLDGWPQFSDAVVDYYFNKKAAFDFIKRSQTPVCIMFDEPNNGVHRLIAANEYPYSVSLTYKVTDVTEGREVASGNATIDEFSAETVDSVVFDGKARFYLIEWVINGKKYKNHYLSGNPPFSLDNYLMCAEKCGLFQTKKL